MVRFVPTTETLNARGFVVLLVNNVRLRGLSRTWSLIVVRSSTISYGRMFVKFWAWTRGCQVLFTHTDGQTRCPNRTLEDAQILCGLWARI